MGETIFIVLILGFCALLMAGIGISQMRSKEPTGFYTWEPKLTSDKISNVSEWNKKHGMMFIYYGICFVICAIAIILIGADSIWIFIPLLVFVILPIILIIWEHTKLVEQYVKK